MLNSDCTKHLKASLREFKCLLQASVVPMVPGVAPSSSLFPLLIWFRLIKKNHHTTPHYTITHHTTPHQCDTTHTIPYHTTPHHSPYPSLQAGWVTNCPPWPPWSPSPGSSALGPSSHRSRCYAAICPSPVLYIVTVYCNCIL